MRKNVFSTPIHQTGRGIALIGGGHTHVAVLADWIAHGQPFDEAVLVTPQPTLRYSGMVPGWIAGHYARDDGLIDIAALAERARVRLVLGRCVKLNPDEHILTTDANERIAFDLASINTGGVGRAQSVLGADDRMFDVRPIDNFVNSVAHWRASPNKGEHVVVAGGGAGGTELAFGLRNLASTRERPRVTMITGRAGLLPDFSVTVRALVRRKATRQDIAILEQDLAIVAGEVCAGGTSLEPVTRIVCALGSAAPEWPRASGLACNTAGFIAVDRYQRSVSHQHVFATGDVAARQDRRVPHSGVHAVFAAPALIANLRSLADGYEPQVSYTPRWNNLYLMSTGDGEAIASYGVLAARGRWVAKLKDWIDRRWIDKYAQLACIERPGM